MTRCTVSTDVKDRKESVLVESSFIFEHHTFSVTEVSSQLVERMSYEYKKIQRGIFGSTDFESFQKCPVELVTIDFIE